MIPNHQRKTLACIALLIFGCAQMAVAFVDVAPMLTGGALVLGGGIYLTEHVEALAEAEPM